MSPEGRNAVRRPCLILKNVYYENHDLNKKYRTPYHLYVIRKGATYDSNLIKVMNNEVREGLHTFASIKEAKLELRE
jgi:putative SOS response-associated peptidase YedK